MKDKNIDCWISLDNIVSCCKINENHKMYFLEDYANIKKALHKLDRLEKALLEAYEEKTYPEFQDEIFLGIVEKLILKKDTIYALPNCLKESEKENGR